MNKFCLGCMQHYDESLDHCPYCGYVDGMPPEESVCLYPGTVLAGRYLIGRAMSVGDFTITYIAWDNQNNVRTAVREFFPFGFVKRNIGESRVDVVSNEKNSVFLQGKMKFFSDGNALRTVSPCDGVVNVYDCFEENGTAYIVCEFLYGETLSEKLDREGAVSHDAAFALMLPVFNGLKKLHANGFVHRDISPDGIFICSDGKAVIYGSGGVRGIMAQSSGKNNSAIRAGYSPSELYHSRGSVGAHTDVYSLAATLYKMITGIVPPDAQNRRQSIEEGGKDTLRPIPGIDKDMNNAVFNAMNIRAEGRTQTIAEFSDELFGDKLVVRRKTGIIRSKKYIARAAMIAVAALLTIFAVLGVLFATGVIGFGGEYRVEYDDPENYYIVDNVYGMTKEQAIALLDTNFTPSVAGQIKTNYKTAGTVTLQDPGAGAYLLVNGHVDLYIAAPEEVVLGQVPYVIASTRKEAVTALVSVGFDEKSITVTEEHSETVAAGLVISQSVEAGTEIVEGEENKITIVVSLGAEAKEVPDVSGMTYEQAKKVLEKAGYVVSRVDENSDTVPENTVIRQSHTEATLGTEITITVSAGRDIVLVSVPNVVGQTEANAARSLSNAGFNVARIEAYSDTVLAGNVISTNPVSGTQLTEGSTVTITVSKGVDPSKTAAEQEALRKQEEQRRQQEEAARQEEQPQEEQPQEEQPQEEQPQEEQTQEEQPQEEQPQEEEAAPKTTVPDVTCQSESSARSAISAASLNVSVTNENSDTVAAGNVIRQSPAAGTSVDKNSTVTIVVSSGAVPTTDPEPAPAPNVEMQRVFDTTGSDQAYAESTLISLGFSVNVQTEYSDTVQKGYVIRQNPQNGEAPKGSVVTIVVSEGIPPSSETVEVSVPDFSVREHYGDIDWSSKNSVDSLEMGDLFVFECISESSSVEKGKIISQDPAAGEKVKVKEGQPIEITIIYSSGPSESTP